MTTTPHRAERDEEEEYQREGQPLPPTNSLENNHIVHYYHRFVPGKRRPCTMWDS
jgi:hypothetical protein